MPGMLPEELIAKIQAAASPEEGLQVLQDAGYELSEGMGGEEAPPMGEDMPEAGAEMEVEISGFGPDAMKKMRDKAVNKAFPEDEESEDMEA